MEEIHTLMNKIALVISIIGLSGGLLIPVFFITEYQFWGGEKIDEGTIFIIFIIFAIICFIGIIFASIIKRLEKKDRYGRDAFIIALIGLIINGLWILIGLPGLLY